MPESTDLTETLIDAAAKPASASVDGQSVTHRSAADLVAIDQYLASKSAAAKRRRGIVYTKLVPPGALSDAGQATGDGFNSPGG